MHASTDLLFSSPSFPLFLPSSSSTLSCQGISSRRMAPSMKILPSIRLSFSHLSAELLTLVFEQLRDIDLESLRNLRLVSRRFKAIATPILYRVLTLNERLVAPDAELQYPNALYHISVHTIHVIVPCGLRPDGINRVLLRIQRLSSIRWQFAGDILDTTELWLPSNFIRLDPGRFRNIELHVDNITLQEFNNRTGNAYIHAIPGRQLKSLTLAGPSPALTARLGSLKQLLLQSPGLQTFHYQDRGQGTSFKFDGLDRMPAIVNLRMRSYNWDHTAEVVRMHWDFSNIESLELISVPIVNFLTSVPFDHLSKLHTLRMDDYSAHLQDRRQEATAGLYILIKNHIRALETLDITCHTQLFPLDAILTHSLSLQVLRFRDHVGFCEDDRLCPTLSINDVALLARNLKHVHTLELDMDIGFPDQLHFLNEVCQFPSLKTLTLNVQTVVHPFENISPGTDRDYSAAMSLFYFLLAKRPSTFVRWAKVIIKVGGWKPIMVRRLGSGWREHNENGVFAERCFILERDVDGGYSIMEEVGFESPSRRSTPDI